MKPLSIGFAVLFAVPGCDGTTALAAEAPLRASYGRLEHVRVVDATPIEVSAALDPAAEYSILNAVGIKYFQRDADTWVRFTVDNGSVLSGNRVTLERRVLKDIRVKQADGGVEHQPRVALEFCLGVQDFKTEVRLVERSGYTAPLLLAQPDLAHLGNVDTQRQFTQEPRCIPPQSQTEVLPRSPVNAVDHPGIGTTRLDRAPSSTPIAGNPPFSCDRRIYCQQMHSCEEAKFFLSNCPGVKMDGDHDGIPCEEQLCGH